MTGLQTSWQSAQTGISDSVTAPLRFRVQAGVTTPRQPINGIFACSTLETLVSGSDGEGSALVLRGCPRLQDFDVHGQLSYEAELHELLV
jgi:hypothetical protein